MADATFTPYSTVLANVKSLNLSWVPETEQDRINAYRIYEQLYWNYHAEYKLTTRGAPQEQAVYLPRPMTIVETVNRYVGADFGYVIDPEVGTPQQRDLAESSLAVLFRREKILSRYNAAKRFGLIHGDWLWHLMADVNKPQGSRLRVISVDPGSYFPVYLDNDPDRLWKVHLAERFKNPADNKFYVRRLTYAKTLGQTPTGESALTGPIIWSLSEFEDNKWFTKGGEGEGGRVLVPETQLPPDIEAIPVFHIPNFDQPGSTFGSSELRGFERVLAAINQGASDQDLALALMGLGVYATDTTASPKRADGTATDWSIYPGKVIQGAEGLRKLEGISSVDPYLNHLRFLIEELGLASGASAAATGTVDVSVAESGVALAIHLAPMLAKAAEKDQVIEDVMAQLLFNLQRWFRVFEGVDFTECSILPSFGDKLPVNRQAEVNMVASLMSTEPPLMSAATGREYLTERCGIQFADNESDLVLMERQAITLASAPSLPSSPAGLPGADEEASRMNAELEAGEPDV